MGWRKGEGGRGGENVDDGERAAVSFELEPERDGARSGIWLYMQEQSRREGLVWGLPEYCDITAGRQPGIALANIHRRMERVCGRRMLDGVYISNVAGS